MYVYIHMYIYIYIYIYTYICGPLWSSFLPAAVGGDKLQSLSCHLASLDWENTNITNTQLLQNTHITNKYYNIHVLHIWSVIFRIVIVNVVSIIIIIIIIIISSSSSSIVISIINIGGAGWRGPVKNGSAARGPANFCVQVSWLSHTRVAQS